MELLGTRRPVYPAGQRHVSHPLSRTRFTRFLRKKRRLDILVRFRIIVNIFRAPFPRSLYVNSFRGIRSVGSDCTPFSPALFTLRNAAVLLHPQRNCLFDAIWEIDPLSRAAIHRATRGACRRTPCKSENANHLKLDILREGSNCKTALDRKRAVKTERKQLGVPECKTAGVESRHPPQALRLHSQIRATNPLGWTHRTSRPRTGRECSCHRATEAQRARTSWAPTRSNP